MTKQSANLEIKSVTPTEHEPGNRLKPVVEVYNRNTSAAQGETYDLGWITIDSPSFSWPIMWDCFIIEPGQTLTRESDCSSAVSDCLGDVIMPEHDLSLQVSAGGQWEGTNCADAPYYGDETDTWYGTVEAVEPIDPSLVSVTECGVEPTFIDTSDDSVRFTARVKNDNATAVDAHIQWFDADGVEIIGVVKWLEGFGFISDIQTGTLNYDHVSSTFGYGDLENHAQVTEVYPPGSYTA